MVKTQKSTSNMRTDRCLSLNKKGKIPNKTDKKLWHSLCPRDLRKDMSVTHVSGFV